ncbi:MAG: hypothetical protein IJ666_08045 [Ruminococcus sp.]|nr:hypothetical protein [Ruminococcus sp.]
MSNIVSLKKKPDEETENKENKNTVSISKKSDDDLEFEDMMKERFSEEKISEETQAPALTDERLREMNKKLPDWNLEPPFTFLK